MTRIGITGHRGLSPAALTTVAMDLAELLDARPRPLVAISSLAEGPDQLLAELVLERGGGVLAVIPADGYEDSFDETESLAGYRRLLARADEIEVLGFASASNEAFLAAGRRVVERCDELVAIWDGEPARGVGGTGDVVAYAQRTGRAVTVVWPEGAERG
jgi:hypothetical protein